MLRGTTGVSTIVIEIQSAKDITELFLVENLQQTDGGVSG
ncbi:MAG: hypothetical protein JWN70_1794 [Planctomycetaceae bacterium]|nr:hypothetical protein [Planctomycetaceae bacterium]